MSSNPILILIQFLRFALEIYNYVFLAYILLSWFPIDPANPLARFIRGLCEPLYRWVLKIFPPLRLGMFDFSIMYIVILFFLLDRGLILLAQVLI